jgi:excisionase family DNA binding protein
MEVRKGRDLFAAAATLQALALDLATAAKQMEALPERADAEDEEAGPLLQVRDVAQRLALPKSSVYMLIQRGDLPAVRFGKALRVMPQDLEVYVAASRLVGGGG